MVLLSDIFVLTNVRVGGDPSRAAILKGYADAALRAQGFEREFTETITHDRLSALLMERLGSDEISGRLAQGAALSPEAAIALSLSRNRCVAAVLVW